MLFALSAMLFTLCSSLSALCSLLFALRPQRYALRSFTQHPAPMYFKLPKNLNKLNQIQENTVLFTLRSLPFKL